MSDENPDQAKPENPAVDPLDGPEWNRPRSTNRLTVMLAVALVAALGFLGGVFAQQRYDSGGPVRMGPGGAGAIQRAPDGASGTRQGRPDDAAPAAPAVVGTVASISDSTFTVTNFAGASVTVVVPPTATVTAPGVCLTRPPCGPTVGAAVSVVGTTGADGVVTAASIISRAGG